MTEKNLDRISFVLAIALMAVMVLLVCEAGATDRTPRAESEANTDVVSKVSGSKSLAMSSGLGDVDIAGCLGSTQWSTPVYSRQKLVPNWACLAEFYFRSGQPELFAMAMCNTDIRAEFESEHECRKAHDFIPVAPAVVEIVRTEEDDEYHQQTQAEIDELRRQLERAQRPKIVQAQPFIDAERRAKLEALREKP